MNSLDLKRMDDGGAIRNIDSSDMLSRLMTFGRQCRQAVDIGKKTGLSADIPKNISGIVVSGLGGSAIGGDCLGSCLADRAPVPILVNREYTLPSWVSAQSFLFVVSYSGNTEETLSVFDNAAERRIPLVCITSGGQLGERARSRGKTVLTIPPGYPPRTALGFLFFPMLPVLATCGLGTSEERDVDETIDLLSGKAREYGPSVPFEKNRAKQVAAALYGRLPLLYASERLFPAARRWQTQINENAEMFAHTNVFPELNHNEIMSWEGLSTRETSFQPVLLRDGEEQSRLRVRIDTTRDLLEAGKLNPIEVRSEGSSTLARLFSLICLGDFVSFYLAILQGVDPTPVEGIEQFKKRLQSLVVDSSQNLQKRR